MTAKEMIEELTSVDALIVLTVGPRLVDVLAWSAALRGRDTLTPTEYQMAVRIISLALLAIEDLPSWPQKIVDLEQRLFAILLAMEIG